MIILLEKCHFLSSLPSLPHLTVSADDTIFHLIEQSYTYYSGFIVDMMVVSGGVYFYKISETQPPLYLCPTSLSRELSRCSQLFSAQQSSRQNQLWSPVKSRHQRRPPLLTRTRSQQTWDCPVCPLTLPTGLQCSATRVLRLHKIQRNTKFSPGLVVMKTVYESITSLMCDVCWSAVLCHPALPSQAGQARPGQRRLAGCLLSCRLPTNQKNQLERRLYITHIGAFYRLQ